MVEGQAKTSDAVQMTDRVRLGRSDLEVPRLGVGAMTWGSPSGRSRWGPAKLAYGGTPGPEEERRAFEASLSAGVEFFDTAAMYSAGASERRLGELAEGKRVVIATKFPPGWLSRQKRSPVRWIRALLGSGAAASICTSTTFRPVASRSPRSWG
jgi:aryl-alcohol dehydrogenase-like predicted oxidoreductase